MQHIGLAFCIIIYGTKHVIGVDVPITCTPRNSPTTSGNPDSTTVSCNAGETMVSCGISGTDRIGGTYIDSSGVCTAYDYSSTANLFAVAHCCVFPTGASVTTSTVSSTTGTDVSASCPTGSQLTGCVGLRMSDDADLILGAYPGLQPSAPPPQTSSWISTSNTCNAVSNSPTTVQAVARCVAVSNTDYALTCETKAAFTNTDNFGTCNTDYDMMSCVGFTPTGLGLDAYFVTGSDTCWVQMDSHANQYASAICCRLVLTTLAPSETPSKSPTKIPTETKYRLKYLQKIQPKHHPNRLRKYRLKHLQKHPPKHHPNRLRKYRLKHLQKHPPKHHPNHLRKYRQKHQQKHQPKHQR
eukprot:411723_1